MISTRQIPNLARRYNSRSVRLRPTRNLRSVAAVG